MKNVIILRISKFEIFFQNHSCNAEKYSLSLTLILFITLVIKPLETRWLKMLRVYLTSTSYLWRCLCVILEAFTASEALSPDDTSYEKLKYQEFLKEYYNRSYIKGILCKVRQRLEKIFYFNGFKNCSLVLKEQCAVCVCVCVI